MSDELAMRYWSTPPHTDVEQTRVWLESMLSADPASSDDFILEHRSIPIGKLGAWRLPEIGFFLRPDHWGRGLASEALGAFADYMKSRKMPCLTADVDPLNTQCLRLLARAGFEVTGRASGTYRVGDRVCDSVYLRLPLQ